MALSAIRLYLKEKIGLNANSTGLSVLESAVRRRMKLSGVNNIGTYNAVLHKSDDELQELIEEVVVPETWFYRNPLAFSALQNYVENEWQPANSNSVLSVLSLPCSSGEESYTIAMTLDSMGLQANEYHIDAFDISYRLLEKAKRGVYGKHSFRNKENIYRDKYFKKIDDTFLVKQNLQNLVNYQQGNLLSAEFFIGINKYDVIFCRNLLIYFDRKTQENVIQKLKMLLNENGILFLGHAEIANFISQYFVQVDNSKAFVYKAKRIKHTRTNKINTNTANSQFFKKDSIENNTNAQWVNQTTENQLKQNSTQSHSNNDYTVDNVLRDAARLANQGLLKEASDICEQYLSKNDSNARAYYILGVIREAQGEHEAVGELMKKAITLDPNHHEALIHLALNAGRKGDLAITQKIHSRTRKIKQKIK